MTIGGARRTLATVVLLAAGACSASDVEDPAETVVEGSDTAPLVADEPRSEDETSETSPEPEDERVELDLGRITVEPRMVGRVVFFDAEGGPTVAADREIRWVADAWAARTPEAAGRRTAEGRTDADGVFALPSPPDGSADVSVWIADDDGWRLLDRQALHYADGFEGGEVVFATRRRDHEWRARIVDPDGEPVPEATVELVLGWNGAPLGELRPAVHADAEGRVSIERIEDAPFYADVTAPGFAPARFRVARAPRGAASGEFRELVLRPGRRITGRVVAPSAGWREWMSVGVSMKTPVGRPTYPRFSWRVEPDADGNFEAVLPAGRDAVIEVIGPAVSRSVELPFDEHFVEVHLPLLE